MLGATASGGASALPAASTSYPLLQHQQQWRGMTAVVNVNKNNVDQAFGALRTVCRDAGLYEELRKRRYRPTTSELKLQRGQATFNKRMGSMIKDRLKWVMKRRKIR